MYPVLSARGSQVRKVRGLNGHVVCVMPLLVAYRINPRTTCIACVIGKELVSGSCPLLQGKKKPERL